MENRNSVPETVSNDSYRFAGLQIVFLLFTSLLIATSVQAQSATAQSAQFSLLHTFTSGADGERPQSDLTRDSEGNVYGTTMAGGSNKFCLNCGAVYKIDSDGHESILFGLPAGIYGGSPVGGLLPGGRGGVYGTTQWGGLGGGGVVFRVKPSGQPEVVYSFTGKQDGYWPSTDLVRDTSGNIYGTTRWGGDMSACYEGGCGVVFKVDAIGHETVLHAFSGGSDGSYPNTLIRGADGNLYGTAQAGGDFGFGVVYKLDAFGNQTVLYSFKGGSDGSYPGGLVRDSHGNLYGTTLVGGDTVAGSGDGLGTVYKLDSTGILTVLYTFTGQQDGRNPSAGLLSDTAGNLYGMTQQGGTQDEQLCLGGCGTVFKIDLDGQLKILHSFNGLDGSQPISGRLLWYRGSLYGATQYGGNVSLCYGYGCGVVFKISLQQ